MQLLLDRIRGEYLEMPGLRLTARQVGRLSGFPTRLSELALARLVGERFLVLNADGTYCRLTSGPAESVPTLRDRQTGGHETTPVALGVPFPARLRP